MDLNDVERLMRLMKEHDLVEIELEDPEQGSRIRLKKATPETHHHPVLTPTLAVPAAAPVGLAAVAAPAAAPAASAPAEDPAEEDDRSNLLEVPSPMVGSFYRSPSPDADSFVEVGDRIDEESVVCIIEAMKVMNEIKAEVSGELVEILVENGEAVEFGQPLFLLRTDS